MEATALFPSVLPANSGEGPSSGASTSANVEDVDPDEEPRNPSDDERNVEEAEEQEGEDDE